MKRKINKVQENHDDLEIINRDENRTKLETLYDFVDIETLTLYKSSYNERITSLKSIREVVEPIIEKLLASINQRIFEVK